MWICDPGSYVSIWYCCSHYLLCWCLMTFFVVYWIVFKRCHLFKDVSICDSWEIRSGIHTGSLVLIWMHTAPKWRIGTFHELPDWPVANLKSDHVVFTSFWTISNKHLYTMSAWYKPFLNVSCVTAQWLVSMNCSSSSCSSSTIPKNTIWRLFCITNSYIFTRTTNNKQHIIP